MRTNRRLALTAAITLMGCCLLSDLASGATVRITKLVDVSLLSLNPFANASSSQSVCVYSSTATKGYNVTATGSGAASAFTLSGGASVPVLPYSVQWSQLSGQTSGTALASGVALTGQISIATQQSCGSGPATSASLIVLLSTSNLQNALAGITYTGVLTLVIAPE